MCKEMRMCKNTPRTRSNISFWIVCACGDEVLFWVGFVLIWADNSIKEALLHAKLAWIVHTWCRFPVGPIQLIPQAESNKPGQTLAITWYEKYYKSCKFLLVHCQVYITTLWEDTHKPIQQQKYNVDEPIALIE